MLVETLRKKHVRGGEKSQDVWAVYQEVKHITQGAYDAQFSEDVQLYPFNTTQEWKANKIFL